MSQCVSRLFSLHWRLHLCQWVSSTCLSVPTSWIPLNYLETERNLHLPLRLLCLQSAAKQKPRCQCKRMHGNYFRITTALCHLTAVYPVLRLGLNVKCRLGLSFWAYVVHYYDIMSCWVARPRWRWCWTVLYDEWITFFVCMHVPACRSEEIFYIQCWLLNTTFDWQVSDMHCHTLLQHATVQQCADINLLK